MIVDQGGSLRTERRLARCGPGETRQGRSCSPARIYPSVTPVESQSVLEVRQLTKTYRTGAKELTVLRDVSFSVAAGATCAIIGPSGSGKTTLLGLCAGLDRATSGSVQLAGITLDGLDEDARAQVRNERTGFVFQNFQLIPTLTALENVMVPAELRPRTADRLAGAPLTAEALRLLGQVGLAERAGHYPAQLSGGEQQRVALARAFINRPQILFADEPTGNLDAETSARVVELLFALNAQGRHRARARDTQPRTRRADRSHHPAARRRHGVKRPPGRKDDSGADRPGSLAKTPIQPGAPAESGAMTNQPLESGSSPEPSPVPTPQASSGISRRQMLAASAAIAGGSLFAADRASAAEATPGDSTPHVNFSLTGKSAIVTGAARGIGRAIALALAAAGADVMGLDICGPVNPSMVYPPSTPRNSRNTGKMVEKLGRRWIGIQADVRDLNALKAAAERADKEFGKIDITVANAAIQIYGPLAETTDANWNDVIGVNLTGAANTMRAVLPYMIPRKYGRIVLISSGQGRHGFKEAAGYSTSKWGLIGLMKSVALEVGKDQITVNTVEPGLVDTYMTRNPGRWKLSLQEAGKPVEGTPTEQEVIAARLPQSVMGIPWMQADEVAPAVVFLASDAANRVTGATYDATAGDSAHYTA